MSNLIQTLSKQKSILQTDLAYNVFEELINAKVSCVLCLNCMYYTICDLFKLTVAIKKTKSLQIQISQKFICMHSQTMEMNEHMVSCI